jgi:hypothetical protein
MDNGVIALVSLAVALVFYKVVNSDSGPSKPVTQHEDYDDEEDDYDSRGGTRRKRSKRKTKRR